MALTLAHASISLEQSRLIPHSFSRPDSSHSHTSHSSLKLASSSPSLYVTFKVLQLVKSFQRRVKTRVRSRSPDTASTTEEFCQDFERQAFEEIDKCLGRKTSHPCSAGETVVVETSQSKLEGSEQHVANTDTFDQGSNVT